MIKQAALFTAGITLSLLATAQAFEGKVRYGKLDEPAIVMVYDYAPEVVESALSARLADERLKGERSRGFEVYTNAVIDEISKTPLDYSFKTAATGSGGTAKTTLYMVMQTTQPIDNPAVLATNGKAFLEQLSGLVKRSYLIGEIKKQETVLVEEETKLLELQKEQQELEAQLEKNKQEQQSRQRIINSQKAMLADLKKQG